MALKRKVDTGGQGPPQQEQAEEEEGSDLPLWLQEQSWSEWFKKVFASRLFALACLAIDIFLGLDLARRLGENSWAVLPVLALLIAGEVTIYLYLWGSKGRLR
jgi:hypothetical protein